MNMVRGGEIRERAVKGTCFIRSLERLMKGRNAFMDVKKSVKESHLLPA